MWHYALLVAHAKISTAHTLVTVMIVGLVTTVKLETFVTMLIAILDRVAINAMDTHVIVTMDIEVLTVMQLIIVTNRQLMKPICQNQFVKMDQNVVMAEKDPSANVTTISLVNFANFKISVW